MLGLTRHLLASTALTRAGALALGIAAFAGEPLSLLGGGAAYALPQQGQVVGGSASIVQVSPTQLDIVQSSSRAVIDWQSFSIGANETTQFIQPGTSSIAVNRVVGVDPSQILGRLTANGQVVLVNPNGILFGRGARVDVGGLVASTSGITTQNAMAGKMIFDQGGNANATIENDGRITARDGGLVALVAPSVVNNGIIQARLGKVSLASGDKWTLDLYGDNLVSFDVTDKVKGSVTNTGTIRAGSVAISANAAKDIVGNAINMGGVVEATSVHQDGGTIILDGGDGNVSITGKLLADASGTGTGGTITAITNGVMDFDGVASAKGGSISGDGGYVETSGGTLSFANGHVDTSAANGKTGNWLLDPYDLSINASGAAAIDSALAGSNVTIQTSAATSGTSSTSSYGTAISGGGGNISVNSAISWSSANSLTLSAYNSILVNANISDSAAGNVVLRADNTGIDVGSVTNSATISTGGSISLYYNPSGGYASPSTFTGLTGTGGVTKYMLVNTATDLQNVANNLTATYALGSNIAAVGAFTTLGSSATPFTGLFDGNGGLGSNYSISGATITGTTYVGLFGKTNAAGTIRNVTVTNETVSATTSASTYIGGLVGYNNGTLTNDVVQNVTIQLGSAAQYVGAVAGYNAQIISGVTASGGTISGTAGTQIGGLVGTESSTGTMTSVTGSVNITLTGNSQSIGGLAGYLPNGTVIAGTVSGGTINVGSGSGKIGGLVGQNNQGTISGSSFAGTILAGTAATSGTAASYVGGLVGYNSGKVTGAGTVSGTISVGSTSQDIGGLIGYASGTTSLITGGLVSATAVLYTPNGTSVGGLVGDNDTGSTISSGTANESVSAGKNIGGFAGYNAGTITGISASNSVTGGYNAGGLVGDNYGSILNSTASNGVSVGTSAPNIGGVAGLNYGLIGGDAFTGNIIAGAGSYYIGGIVGENIVNAQVGTVSAGAFSGTITVGTAATAVGGLVGYNSGTVTGAGVVSGAVTVGNNSTQIGGLVGYSGFAAGNGTVTATASVAAITGGLVSATAVLSTSGGTNVGGLVGYNDAGSTISGGTANEAVSAQKNVGGFVGYNAGVVTAQAGTNSVAAGTLAVNVGGLVGYNTGALTLTSYSGTISALSGAADIGGLIGFEAAGQSLTAGTFSGTINAGTVNTAVGGLVGYNNGGTISDGTVSGAVSVGSNSSNVGGLVGYSGYGAGTSVTSKITGGTVLGTAVLSTPGGTSVGGLVGYNDAGSTISGGTASEAVSGGTNVGGLVGGSNGLVTGVTASNQVTGYSAVGGLIGSDAGLVTASSDSGTVQGIIGGTNVGGLIGLNQGGTISGDSSSGTVSAGTGASNIGGLVGGMAGGTVSGGTASGTIIAGIGDSSIGGLVGKNNSTGGTVSGGTFSGTILAGTATTSGTAASYVGGLIGYNAGIVTGTGTVSGVISVGSNAQDVGGLVGYATGTGAIISGGLVSATAVFSVPNGTAIGGLVGYNDTGSTISGGTANEAVSIAGVASGLGGYVGTNAGLVTGITAANNVTAGSSSNYVGGLVGLNSGSILGASDTGLVSAASGSNAVGGLVGQSNSGLLSGVTATGTLIASGNSLGGLAGFNGGPGTITGATSSETISITATSSNIGGLAGGNSGTIISSSYTGTIATVAGGSGKIGGLVGYNSYNTSALVINGSVSGSINVGSGVTALGGLVGYNTLGAISGGTFTGTILAGTAATSGTAASYVGGLVGYSSGTITNYISGTTTTAPSVSGTISAGTNSQDVGGLVGYSTQATSVAGTVTTTTAASILAGSISSATVFAPGAGATAVGGLVGYNNTGSTISGGIANEAVSGASAVGGFVGYNAGLVTGITATSSVTGGASSTAVGGIVGYNTGKITASSVTGTVNVGTNSFAVGGLAGFNYSNGTAIGTVAGDSGTGGVTAGAGSTYIHATNQIGCDETAGCAGTPGQQTITVTAAPITTTYGTAAGALSYTPTGTLESGDTYTTILSGSVSQATTAAGTYAIGQGSVVLTSPYAALDYTISYVSANEVINKAALTITPTGTQTYGGSNASVSYAYNGLVNGDTSAAVTGVSYTTPVTTASTVGSYGVTATGGVDSNYTITDATGTYSVGKATVTITPTGSQTYGGTNVTITYSYNGLVNGDSSTALSNVSYTTTATSSSSVGNYTATETGATGANYTIVAGTGAYSVTPAALTITPTGTQTYGGSNASVSYAYNGLVNGDTSSAITGVSYTTPVTSASTVGSYGVTATGGVDSNYTITDATGTYSVGKATVTITPTGSQTYGGTNVTITYSYNGLVNGDSSTALSNVSYTTTATSSSSVGNYTATETGATGSNYTIVAGTGAYSVTPAALTITPTGTQTYGGSNASVSYAYNGLVNGDTSSAITGVSYTTPVTTASTVGSYGVTATGGVDSNYTITDATGTYTVGKATVTITPTGSQIYGGTNVTITYSYNGLVNGDSSTALSNVSYTTTATSSSSVGNYTATETGATGSNYTIVAGTGAYSVTPAALTITPTGTQTYGGSNASVSYAYNGLVNGDTSSAITGVSYTTPVTTASTVGSYGVTATGGVDSNYTITDATGTYTVGKATVTITPTGSQTYGGTNVTITYSYNGLVNGDSSTALSNVSYTTTATSSSSVGNYTATETGATGSNYTIVAGTGAYSVTPAALTITPTGTQTYGGSNASVSYAYNGLVNGDTSSAITGVSYTTPVTTASTVGSYGVTATGGVDSNYTITDATGTYTVGKATVTITPTGSQIYGGTNVTITYSYNGLVNGDSSTALSNVSYTTTATSSSSVGNYTATETGATGSNYTIVAGTGAYSVTPAALTITPTGTQTYGGSNASVSYAYNGLVNGDTSSAITGVSYTTPVTTASTVGSYGVTATGGVDSNYTITDATGTYTVGKATVTITPTGSQIYGGTNVTITYSYNGLVNGDSSTALSNVSYTTTATSSSSVGNYTATETGATGSNYTIVAGTGAYSVTPAALTITPTGTQTYGGSNASVSYAYNGLVNGDTSGAITGVSYTTPVTTASTVGSYGVTATGGVDSNYTITDATGVYTVGKATVTITPTGSQTYGGTNVTITYSYNGLVNGDSSTALSNVSYTTTATSSSSVGNYTATETGATGSNYTIVAGTGAYSVTPAALTITPTGTQTYGGSNASVSYAYNGLVNGDTSSAITGVSYTTPVTTASTVGSYGVTATGGVDSNYTITDATGTYTVGKATVTITPTGSQTYGGTNVTITYSYNGLVNGDSSTALSNVSYTTTATSSSSVGNYTATETGATGANYTIVAGTGAYSVTPAALTITPTGTQTYGGSNASVSYAYNGLVNGDTSSAITGVSYTTPVTTASTVGSYGVTATGGVDSNYTITDATGTYTVGKATVTITPTGSQTYGGTNVTITYSYNGLVNGDSSTALSNVSYTTTATSSSSVGNYTATETGATGANYTIVAGTGAYSVTPAALTITPTGTQTYGGSNASVSYAYNGLVNGDTSSAITGVSYTTPVTSASTVGSYGVTATGGVDSNYTITDATGTYSVGKATVTITPTGSQTYGGTNVTITYSYNGLVNGDSSTALSNVSYTTTATSSSSVGNYTATETGATGSNYTIVAGTGAYSVTPAALTITPTGTQTYGGGNASVSYAYNGLVNGDTSGAITGVSYTTPVTSASTVGSYGVTATGGVDSNYTITDATGTYTVGKATVTITPTGSQIYGGTNVTITYSYVGLASGDTSSSVTGVTYTTTATSSSSVGSYTATETGAVDNDYTIVAGTGAYSVTPAALTITPTGTQTYGGSNKSVSYAYNGLVNGDTSGAITGVSYTTPVTTASTVGSYGVTATGGADANYTITDATGVYTVGKAGLTVAVNDSSRTYGASDPAYSSTLIGLTNGDGSGVVTGINYTSTDPTQATVGAYSILGYGASASNYSIVYTTGTLSVTPAGLTVTAAHETKTYGSSDPTLSYSVTGLQYSDTSSAVLSGSVSRNAGENTGSYNINQNTLASNSNYTLTYVGNTLSITPATLTVTAAHEAKTYGASDPTLSYSVSGLQFSDTTSVVTGALGRDAGQNVGSYNINQNGLGAGSNYTVSYVGNTLSITPATLTVTAAHEAKTYGASDPTLSYSVSGYQYSDNSSVITGALSRDAGQNVGSYNINQNGLGAGSNYTVSYVGNTLSITPATLTVTASHEAKTYGAADPTLSYSVSGYQYTDDSSVITGVLSRDAGQNTGSYNINQNGLGAGSNYTVSYVGNTLSITPATLTITAAHEAKTYGASDPTLSYSVTGLQYTDTTSSVITGSLNRDAGENTGSYNINQNTLAANTNYMVSYVGNTLSITPATLIVTAAHETKTYGASDPTLSYSVSGLQFSDTTSVITGALNRNVGQNTGSYTINQNGLGAGSNYTVSYVGNTLSITPATLTVTAAHETKTYGASDPTLSYSVSGYQYSDNSSVITGALSRDAGQNVGSYNINQNGLGAGSNYTVSYVSNTLSVTPASLTVAVSNTSRTYGASDPSYSSTLIGLTNGDGSSVVTGTAYTSTDPAQANVGTYAILAYGAAASNYSIVYSPGTLNVTPAGLTVTAAHETKTYGSSDPTLSYSVSGLQYSDTTSGVLSGMVSRTTGENVGSYAINQNTLASNSNYTLTYVGNTLSVTPASLTITAGNAIRAFGAPDPAYSVTYQGLTNGDTSGVVSGLSVTSNDPTNAAYGTTWQITPSGAMASNYAISYVHGTLTIAQGILTIIANNATRTYGSANPTFSATYIGLQNGDNSSIVTGLSYVTTGLGSGVGSYTITPGGATAGNYALDYVTGTLLITPAPLVITANNATRASGQADPVFTASFNGLVNGDSPATIAGLSYLSNDPANSGSGVYQINVFGGSNPNYMITYAPGILNITDGTPNTNGFNLGQVVSQQISTNFSTASFIVGQTSAVMPFQTMITTLSSDSTTGSSNSNTTSTCLRTGGNTESDECSAAIAIRGY